MTRDFEAQLQQALQARAADVTPNPALYARVQSRIRRGRMLRVAAAGAATALAVTGIALAAPRLTERRVEFEPPAVATQPAAEPTVAASEDAPVLVGPHPMVYTDGTVVYGLTVKGRTTMELIPSGCPENGVCDMEPVRSVSVRPTHSEDDVTVVSARTCGGLLDNLSDESFMDDTCPTSVTFSPDGRHLAWVGQAGPDGEWMLQTASWTDTGIGDDAASFGLGFGAAETVRLDDWANFNADEGRLYFQVTGPDGVSVVTRTIERQPDGALALPGCGNLCDLDGAPYRPVGGMPDYTAVAAAAGALRGDEYVLEVLVRDGAVEAAHVADAPNGRYLDLPETFVSRLDPADIDQLWLSSAGTQLLLGDGKGVALTAAWAHDDAPIVQLDNEVVHGDLLMALPTRVASEAPVAATEFEVHFGMTGADACVADQPVTRETQSRGVARAALTELLKGPSSRESNEGIESPFTANTADALNNIEIVDGQARVDFRDFSADVGDDSCTKSAIEESLDRTLMQFATVQTTRYSFEGSVEAWNTWLGVHSESPPAPVTDTRKASYDAARNRNWDALRRLSKGTACTMSDQPEPCVPYWKDQEAAGEDPLGNMIDVLNQGVAKNPDAAIWAWPSDWFDTQDYQGPRIGIDEDGKWLYFVQSGG